MRNLFFILLVVTTLISFNACSSAEGDNPGTEYMPDMFHSIAYEANLNDYYYYNTWGTEDDYYKIAQPREPINGTIPRGYSGNMNPKYFDGSVSTNAMSIPMNGSVPYYYTDTEEERTRAMAEIIKNPYPISTAGLEVGKNLYDINCGICHGKKGDGNGWLVDEANAQAVYPAQPANLISEEFVAASNGRFYHGIMYGKNVMGGYADKLSYEERWQVIHYIRSLQAKDRKLVYSQEANTLNAVGVPGGAAPSGMGKANIAKIEVPMLDGHGHDADGHHEDGGHGGGHDHDGGNDHSDDHGHGH